MKRLAAFTLVALLGCGGASAHAASKPKLTDLRSVAQLQTQFKAHGGRPRLILLMSPT
jgi:hypothetical protein